MSKKTLADFPITEQWPAENPELMQLYSFPTPNGVKASIALEEMGLAYEAHRVTLSYSDVKSDAFLSLNAGGDAITNCILGGALANLSNVSPRKAFSCIS